MTSLKPRKLFIVSGASGTGKTTLCKLLVAEHPKCKISVSFTTRKPRDYESNGVHYHFIDREVFEEKIKNEDFLEWAEVFGNYYGTCKKQIDSFLNEGFTPVFDIDRQGAVSLKKAYGDDALLVFLLPPSFAELKKRLFGRKSDSEEVIKERLKHSLYELRTCLEYDFVLLNEDLESCYSDLLTILAGKSFDDKKFRDLVSEILSNIDSDDL